MAASLDTAGRHGWIKPSGTIAPTHDTAMYLVLDEFADGCMYRETDEAEGYRETVIQDIVAANTKSQSEFNTADATSPWISPASSPGKLENCRSL